jgi:hypothetical protein
MTFPEFVSKHYREEPGRAVPLLSVIRKFYADDPQASFDWPPAAIKRFLESKFPVGTFNCEAYCGNLAGPDSILVCDRALIVFGGELLPRDITPDEFEFYGRATRHFKSRTKTLSRDEMGVRGWGKRILSRAQRLTKADY